MSRTVHAIDRGGEFLPPIYPSVDYGWTDLCCISLLRNPLSSVYRSRAERLSPWHDTLLQPSQPTQRSRAYGPRQDLELSSLPHLAEAETRNEHRQHRESVLDTFTNCPRRACVSRGRSGPSCPAPSAPGVALAPSPRPETLRTWRWRVH